MKNLWGWWRRGERVFNITGGTAEWALCDWFSLNEILETLGLPSLEPKRPLVLHVGLQRVRTGPLLAANTTG